MCSLISPKQPAAGAGEKDPTGKDEAVMLCPFCGSDRVACLEVDAGLWAICCSWCRTIGPHCRSTELARARWNATAERQAPAATAP